ncbi:MAG: hypothetical protein AB7E72_01620 [Lysobacterales bacterium]
MTNAMLFNTPEAMMIQGALAGLRHRARANPFRFAGAALATLLLLGICLIDWEIFLRLFQYLSLSGDYWTPELLACSPAAVLASYHVLASRSPDHPAVRLIGILTACFVVLFAVGCGAYISSILMTDAGAPGDMSLPLPPLGELPLEDAPSGDWLGALMAKVTSPTATLMMSIGVGGLTVTSLWCGNALATTIEHNLREGLMARRNLREGLSYWKACQQAEQRYAELSVQRDRLLLCTEDQLRLQIAGLTLKTIGEHLLPHRQRLEELRMSVQRTALDENHDEEITLLEKALKPLVDLGLDDVLKAITPTPKRSVR